MSHDWYERKHPEQVQAWKIIDMGSTRTVRLPGQWVMQEILNGTIKPTEDGGLEFTNQNGTPVKASIGDWLVKHGEGKFDACTDDYFNNVYQQQPELKAP